MSVEDTSDNWRSSIRGRLFVVESYEFCFRHWNWKSGWKKLSNMQLLNLQLYCSISILDHIHFEITALNSSAIVRKDGGTTPDDISTK